MDATYGSPPHGIRTNGTAHALKTALPWLGLFLAGSAFLADVVLPLGVAVGACYALAVLTTFAHPHRHATLGMAVLVSVMALSAALATPDQVAPAWVVIINRGIALAGIWGTAALLLAFARLSTRLRTAEVEAHARRAWLAQTLASIGDGVIACNRAGRVEFMNPVAERLTGWRQADAIDNPIDDIFQLQAEASGERIASPVRTALTEGRVVGLSERTNLVGRNGDTWPVDDSAAPIRNEAGEIAGAVMVFRDVSWRRRGEQQMELRLREAGHRIRNVFANVQAILSLCSRSTETPAELVKCVEVRMASLVRSTDRLIRSSEKGSSLREIVVEEVEPYLQRAADRLHISGDDMLLSPSASVSFAMIIHELATNASKYGSLLREDGRIDVHCSVVEDDTVILDWKEVGGPRAEQPQNTGLGTRLMEGLVKTQFSGSLTPVYAEDGYSCRLELNLREEAG